MSQTSEQSCLTVHYAQTLDGRIATRHGQSQWISGSATLRLAHQLRASHQAVLVGVGTIIADDPRLTVRLVSGRSPLRIVADSTLRLPAGANVLTDGAAPTLIATTARAPTARLRSLREQGVAVLVVDQDRDGRVDLRDLLRQLATQGIASVLIEGGRGLITTALRVQIVDRLVISIAPKVLGAGIEAVGDLGIDLLGDALRFIDNSFTQMGEDIVFDGRIERARVRSA